MKKRIFFLVVFLCVTAIGIGALAYPSIPSDDEVLSLIQKAESIYHTSDDTILSTNYENMERFLWNDQRDIIGFYDEVQGYDENVPEVFTKNGISELENAYKGNVPWILKRDGKIYRCSGMTQQDSTTYFHGLHNENPSSLRLLKRTWNRFTYEVSTTPEDIWGSQKPIVVILTVAKEGGKLKIDQFNYPACYRSDDYYTKKEIATFQLAFPEN